MLAWLWANIREQWGHWKRPVGLGTSFLLVACLAFEAGLMKQGLAETQPLILRVPETVGEPQLPEKASAASIAGAQPAVEGLGVSTDPTCVFVGSKKSNKYHSPTSRCASQIKSENRLCFASIDQARARGYQPGCLE